jgi:hypothetical protein
MEVVLRRSMASYGSTETAISRKEDAMKTINELRSRLQKRAAYQRTRAEIERMPLDVALDLNIDKSRAHHIATEAVYGH